VNDGDKVIVVFCGEPFAREMHWLGDSYEECAGKGCEYCAKGKKLTTRVKVNVYVLAEKAMKIIEGGPGWFQAAYAAQEKYGPKAFEIKRHGGPNNKKTKYTVLLEREVTDEERARIAAAPLHNLAVADEEDGDDASPSQDENALISPAVVAEFKERLKRFDKAVAYYPVLGVVGCERLVDIPARDEHRVRQLIERVERGERLIAPQAPLDEFA
jgi:hypothetical protein